MKLTRLILQNFRCFGPKGQTIDFVNETVFVGANGTGKSAALEALVRLFGTSAAERRVVRNDFHLPQDQDPDKQDEMSFVIKARFDFPEAKSTKAASVPEHFNQMTVEGPAGKLFCRVRLEARWRKTDQPDGEIDEKLFWVKTAAPNPEETDKVPMQNFERSRIQVTYVPAARDIGRQIRQVSGSLLYRLLRSVKWSGEIDKVVEEASEELRTAFRAETGVSFIETAVSKFWNELHDFAALGEVNIQPLSGRLEELLRKVEIAFRPGEGGLQQTTDRLSDGLKSLFYFSLVGATFKLEEVVRDKAKAERVQINPDLLLLPSLKIYAIEEAENHLSPHYLGRMLALFTQISASQFGQVVLSSQSPSVLSRIDPATVRHFRLDGKSKTSRVRPITLPEEDQDEIHKYVKEAVRAYPELYFASLVILGEGDSEEIVIPRVAAAHGVAINTSFVSVVPLGGRHVNHFWRLLGDLKIPFLTLLDLDAERQSGGWSTVQNAIRHLIALGHKKAELLKTSEPDTILSDEDFGKMGTWELNSTADLKNLQNWAESLEEYDVFFSSPLDLDFMMLMAFTEQYHKATTGRGPNVPQLGTTEYNEYLEAARLATLKPRGGSGNIYSEDEHAEFIYYSYLFLGRGKPSTHILALNKLNDDQLKAGTPAVLKRLLDRATKKLSGD